MTGLGLSGSGSHSGEIRVGFRTGLVRSVSVVVGGAGLVGFAIGVVELAQKQPDRFFDLLSKWGFVWLLSLVAMALAWDLAKRGIGRLSEAMTDMAVAMNRIADKDDRERDRLITEMAYVGQRMQRLSDEHAYFREEQRVHHREILDLLGKAGK